MNKYKVAESIVNKLILDLKKRMESGAKWDVGDEKTHEEMTDHWEDMVIEELERAEQRPAPAAAQY